MSPLELSKFPNETYLGSVKKQENLLRKVGIEHNPQLVIYNRVPKCGSTTTLDIIRTWFCQSRKTFMLKTFDLDV